MKSLLLASIALAIFGLLTAWLLRRFKIQSPILHRLAWGFVLIQGIAFAGIPLPLAVLDPVPIAELLGSSRPILQENLASLEEVSPLVTISENQPAANSPAPAGQSSNPLWFLYLFGIVGIVGYALAAYAALLIAVRQARPAPEDWETQWGNFLENRDRDRDSIPLLVHDRIGPMLCRLPGGYRVVVPAGPWSKLTEAQREAVLVHEFAHVERRDVWKSLAARLVATLHWFNPMAWWSARQFEEAAEWECDQRLASRGNRHAVEYARALLEFAEPKTRIPIGVSLARGAALSPRIRRLTAGNSAPESRMCRAGLAALFIVAALFALFRFELIAKESSSTPGEAFKEELTIFAEKIDSPGGDVAAFRDVLKTPPGQIVMKDLTSGIEQEKLKSKVATALPDHIERYFAKNPETGKLEPKTDAAGFTSQLTKAFVSHNEDIEKLKPAMAEVRKQLAEESEAGKLFARFLDQEGAAHWLYVKAIRDLVRPGMKVIEDRLGVILTRGDDGKLFVPPSRIAEAEKIAAKGDAIVSLMERIETEIPAFGKDVAEVDDFHKRVKAAMAEPGFAGFIASDLAKNGVGQPVSALVDKLFENLEKGFADTAEGLRVRPEARADLEKFLQSYELLGDQLDHVAEVLGRYAEKIDERDELHKNLKRVLSSEAAVILIVRETKMTGSRDAAYAFQLVIGEVLESGKDGKMRVRKSKQGDVTSNMQEALRSLREARRKGREFDEMTEAIADPELREIYQSSTGKMILVQMIREELLSLQVDGLALWIDQHFEESANGKFRPKAESSEMLARIVKRSNEIAASLKSDF